MENWGSLWLKEGYATYLGWLVVDALFPAWSGLVWDRFVTAELAEAFAADSLVSSSPIERHAVTPGEIEQASSALAVSNALPSLLPAPPLFPPLPLPSPCAPPPRCMTSSATARVRL
jgi:hypothetical protein